MASASDAVWAIDLGNSSVKALHLAYVGDAVQVIAFDNVRHAKVLSGKGISALERDELIAMSVRQIVERNDIGMEDVIVSVPSQNSFARFVTLPPVDRKKIPEIVGFEAAQQIPFDMSEVQWDWQLMSDEDDAEKRVGLFAIKNEIVNAELEHLSREELPVGYVQMAPMALYNYVLYDRPNLFKSEDRPVVVLNIGAEITDLVVCTESTVWQRCILVGGNAFTQAIATAFKINFEKAEKLKRTAAVSKYARQIFQAMRPVFTDLASEVQKSLGFYSSANPNAEFSRIVALGGGTQLRGLLKYLQQSLQVPVERPDMFKRVTLAPGVSAAKFHDSVNDFGVVYGLAVQGLGLAKIESNLLPKSVARSMAWALKMKLFMVAASVFLVVSMMALGRTVFDRVSYDRASDDRRRIQGIISQAGDAESRLEQEEAKGVEYQGKMVKVFSRFNYRDVVPAVYETVLAALPNAQNNPEQKDLYAAFDAGDATTVMQTPRKERKQLFITSLDVRFAENLEFGVFGETNKSEGGGVGMEGMMDPMMMEAYGMGPGGQYGGGAGGDPRMMDPRYMEMMGMQQGEGEEVVSGFLVTIEGYTPYHDSGQLLDPPGVENQPEKWGLVTRLLHIGKADDPNDPNEPGYGTFYLYKKGEKDQFKLEKEFIDAEKFFPKGVGVAKDDDIAAQMAMGVSNLEVMLVDPLTREEICRTPSLNESGKPRTNRKGEPIMDNNDQWFILKFKLAWNEGPVEEDSGAAMGMGPLGNY